MNKWQKESKPGHGSKQWLEEVFTYHAPSDEQKIAYHHVRESAKMFANTILEYVPHCADQNAALRHLREAVMTANAAIALEGLV